MSYRNQLSRKGSNKLFRKGMRVKGKNYTPDVMRGGFRI